MEESLQTQLQELVGDDYLIERELARGGMSRVFLAVERSLGRRVVIKVLAPELKSAISVARFDREIRVTANLQHPNILPVLAFGSSHRIRYYVTPYVEGESLRARLKKEGSLSVGETISILRDVADALAHAHARGVVHRDVKPGNVLLSGGRAVLADFGLAHVPPSQTPGMRLTMTGRAIGTPGYMAPEQLMGDPVVGPPTDVFGLGVLGYEMLAGKSPFDDPDSGRPALTYFTGPEPLASSRPDVPPHVAAAISRAMASDPVGRFANAAEFRAALRGPPPVDATPTVRSPRRRFVPATIVALLFTAFLAVVPASSARPRGDASGASAKTVAVLPFKNLGQPQYAYFADGITEEITSRLAAVSDIAVISRTSADQYRDSPKSLRDIARELGATYVLEGSVRWERSATGREQVRVTPQLIRVSDDSHLWADRYDAAVDGVFNVQTRIAEQVARALEARIADD